MNWPIKFAKFVSISVCVACALFFIIFIFYWFQDVIPAVRSHLNFFYWPYITPITSMCFLLAGFSLWCVVSAKHKKGKQIHLSQIFAGMIIFIGLSKLGANWFGWNPFFNRLDLWADDGSELWRMWSITALMFVLLGCALLLASSVRWAIFFQLLALSVVLIGWLRFSNFVFHSLPLFFLLLYNETGMYISSLFLILGLGVLCARPDVGLIALLASNSKGGVIARYFLLPIVLAPFVFHALEFWSTHNGWLRPVAGAWLFMILNMLLLGIFSCFNMALLHRIDLRRGQMEERNMQLVNIVNSSGDSIIGEDMGGIITSWNNGSEKIFGYTADEMVGSSTLRLVPVERHEEEKSLAERLKQEAKIEHFETLRNTKEGRTITISVTASPIMDGVGKFCGISKVMRDITEHVQAREALHASEERLRIVTENARVGLVAINRDRRYTFANNTYTEMLDLPMKNIIGRHVADVLPHVYENQIRRCLDRAFTGEQVTCELQMTISSGERIFLGRYEPTRQGGPVLFLVAVITDITEQRRAYEEIQSQLEELHRWHEATLGREERIIELKREVNEQLQHRKMAPRYLDSF